MTGPSPALRHALRLPANLYRWHCGWLLGQRFMLLVHRGRRSGREHGTVLEVVEYRPYGPEVIVLSGWGRDVNWLRNLEAAPHPQVAIGTLRFTASYRLLSVDEAAEVIRGYERRNRFVAPLVRTVLSRLLGWHYDGSDAARRRLAGQLPFVAFRPDDSRQGQEPPR